MQPGAGRRRGDRRGGGALPNTAPPGRPPNATAAAALTTSMGTTQRAAYTLHDGRPPPAGVPDVPTAPVGIDGDERGGPLRSKNRRGQQHPGARRPPQRVGARAEKRSAMPDREV